jgi:hypothetical protein
MFAAPCLLIDVLLLWSGSDFARGHRIEGACRASATSE